MKVAFITHYPELYGANRSLLDLIRQLRELNLVDPFVISPRPGQLDDVLAEEGIPHAIFPFQSWMSERQYSGRVHHRIFQHRRFEKAAKERALQNKKLIPKMAKWMKEQDIDLLHANSSVAGIAPMLAHHTGLPFVWHIRELPERQYLLYLDQGKRGYGSALRSATKLIAISEAVKNDVLEYIGRPWPVSLVYNGIIEQQRYAELRASAQLRWKSTEPFVLAMVGLIHPSKGQIEAVEALQLLEKRGLSVRLIIAGTGRDKDLLERIAELGVGGLVEMTGFVQDPYTVFARAHALLMCSRNEAMGRVTVEAMASGLPVVGHASGGTLELVKDNVTGLIYPGGASELADRIERLIAFPELAAELGRNGSKRAEGNYSIERYTEQVWKVFQEATTLVA